MNTASNEEIAYYNYGHFKLAFNPSRFYYSFGKNLMNIFLLIIIYLDSNILYLKFASKFYGIKILENSSFFKTSSKYSWFKISFNLGANFQILKYFYTKNINK